MVSHHSIAKMFGIELEFFLIDQEGNIANDADRIIKALKKDLKETEIKKEVGKAMLELTSFPHISSSEVFGKFFHDFEALLYELEVNDLGVSLYGTYPGKNLGQLRQDPRYAAKEKILGKRAFQHAGRCIGFHYHYSLPRRTFNHNIKFFYPDINSRKKKKVLNLFNLFVALDPAVCTFMQSSPYYEGKFFGKDARMIVYRGEDIWNYPDQLYGKYPAFGRLNKYKTGFAEIESKVRQNANSWHLLLKEQGFNFSDFAKQDISLLDSTWQPVKLSPHGTIESRGADMNSLKKVVAMASAMNYLSTFVQNEFITIQPSPTGIKEPFKLEGDTLFVPTFSYLRSTLQKDTALLGFESREVTRYCKALLRCIKDIIPIESQAPLRIFSKMLEEEKTTSDEIIALAKKRQGTHEEIDDEIAREIALKASNTIHKDLIITKKMCEKNLSNY